MSGEKIARSSTAGGVEWSDPPSGGKLPRRVLSHDEGVDLASWGREHEREIHAELLHHGAILFRGFDVEGVGDFERFAESVCPDLYGDYQDLPREKGGKKTYQATPYPAEKTILFHNESSHMYRWPVKQFFYCVLAAREGGETPVVDGREIYRRLDSRVVREFEERKLLYVRNFIEGFDVSWQEFFNTEERGEVERYCTEAGIDFEWRGSDLQTRQLAPAVVRHLETREPVFFNQIQLHHRACLEPELRDALEAVLGEGNLPRSVLFGDGEPIADELVQEITRLYWDCSVAFPWQDADVLMVDNMLCAHARNPFAGPRKIVVAMGQIVRATDLEAS